MQGAFTGLKRLTKLGLAGNLITSISEKAFDGLDNLLELDLSGNAIRTIHSNALSMMPQLRVFMLNTSSLLCDCSLRWFPLWLAETRIKVDNVVCAYPEHLKGRPITEISHDDFLCCKYVHSLNIRLYFVVVYRRMLKCLVGITLLMGHLVNKIK